MPRLVIVLLLVFPVVLAAERRAKNVILFLADAGGIPTINAASLHGYGAPRRLFVQRMPNIALSDTSSASRFVTDSAAGMTAIVTGQKTNNNMVAQSASGERGVRDGAPLKSILEYAEERGLSTGIITNDALSGATPASLYAKANDRAHTAVIFQQVLGRQRRPEPLPRSSTVVLPHQRQNAVALLGRPGPIGSHPGIAVHQPFGP